MKKTHYVLYVAALPWNLTICWPAVLLIRLFWGENLRWERNQDPKVHDGWSLWCDLKKDSWPTRSWYAHYEGGSWLAWLKKHSKPEENPEALRERFGTYRTWGGTTLGHGGFYGPGTVVDTSSWTRTQDHEHHHVEQFEASVLGGFINAIIVATVLLIAGHPGLALGLGLWPWWAAGFMYGAASAGTAALRGEDGYRGSNIEEAAYALDDDWQDGIPQETKKEEG